MTTVSMLRKSSLTVRYGTILLMLILLLIAVVFQYKSLIDKANQQQLEHLAQAISASITVADKPISTAEQGSLSWLRAYPYIKQSIVFDKNGTGIFRYQNLNTSVTNTFIKQRLQNGVVSEKQIYSDSDVIHFLYPLVENGSALASVYLSVDKYLFEAPFKRLFDWSCITILVLFVCIVALVWLFITHYLLPINSLSLLVSGESDSSETSNGHMLERLRQNFVKLSSDKQDLTEQKQQLELRLAEQQKLLTDAINRLEYDEDAKCGMINVISRELKISLSQVISHIELLKVYVTEAKAHETVSLINDSTHHLLEVINQLQDYVKLSEKQWTLDVKQVDLYRFLKSVVEANYAKANQKKNTLFLNMKCSGMEVMLDPHMLRNVLNNLIDNAIKFSKQGNIELSVSEFSRDKQHFLTLTVKDSAGAINENDKERIFEPFQQFPLHDQQYSGLGLGLTIYAHLVELMNGEYGVNSSTQGNSFWFTIPVDIISVANTSPEARVQINPRRDDKKTNHVLVAEDNEVNQSVALGLLEKLGCTVTLVANGEEAIASCSEQAYDMIFMDYHMPLMNGVTTTEHLRKFLHITTPIVALTADANEQVRLDFYTAGADDILIKPIELNKLIDLVNRFLGKTIEPVSQAHSYREVSEVKPILNKKIVDDIITMAGENGEQVVQQIFQVYMRHTPDLIEAIKQAFIEKNAQQVFKSAHALKSSSLNIGATAIAELAREIEESGRENNLDQIAIYIDKLDTYYDELTSLLNGQWRRI